MRRPLIGCGFVLLVLTVACRSEDKKSTAAPPASAAAVAPARLVTLVPLPARVADHSKSHRKSEMKLDVEFWRDGQKLGSNDTTRTEEYDRNVTVLGVVGRAAAKLRVEYTDYSLREQRPDKPVHEDSFLRGRTYLVDASEGTIAITGDHRQPVSPEERDTLTKLHGDVGQEDPLIAALGTRPIPVARSVPIQEKLFRALVNSGTGDLKGGNITLAGTRTEGGRELADFDWSADMHTAEDSGLEITWHLKGRATVSVSPAATIVTHVDGALDVGGHSQQPGGPADLEGSGSFKDDRTITP